MEEEEEGDGGASAQPLKRSSTSLTHPTSPEKQINKEKTQSRSSSSKEKTTEGGDGGIRKKKTPKKKTATALKRLRAFTNLSGEKQRSKRRNKRTLET